MDKLKIAIVGGGACGLFAAAMLSEFDCDIHIFEKNNKLGKKILASGNGKCNFSNIGNFDNRYNNNFANIIINKYTVKDTLSFFSSKGLVYKNDEQGRCYPISECSSSVLDCLKNCLSNVHINLDCSVSSIDYVERKVWLSYCGKKDSFDYVVCCSGSGASNLGSEKAYIYFDNLNVKFVSKNASLVPVVVKENVKALSGVRVKCLVKLLNDSNKILYQENGEIIFKDNGLSGIAVFNATNFINRNKDIKYKISLDLSNGIEKDNLIKYFSSKNINNVFKGFLNDKLGDYFCDYLSLKNFEKLNNSLIDKIVNLIYNFEFNVDCLYPLKDGQVCSGGISIQEVDENLRLKKYPRIYVGGELLDIDGMCGGYNLQFAWSSAGVICNDIKRRIKVANEKE